ERWRCDRILRDVLSAGPSVAGDSLAGMDESGHAHDLLVYCLTRDHELADAVEGRRNAALPFFYNDAARLHQAVVLRRPDLVLVDTGAIRVEYGDAGLGPGVAFLGGRAPAARLAV